MFWQQIEKEGAITDQPEWQRGDWELTPYGCKSLYMGKCAFHHRNATTGRYFSMPINNCKLLNWQAVMIYENDVKAN